MTTTRLLASSPPRLLTTGQIVARGQSGAITWQGTLAGCVGAAGTAAMLLDSLLGATMEGRQRWMTNDAVNLLAATAGASLAAVLGAV